MKKLTWKGYCPHSFKKLTTREKELKKHKDAKCMFCGSPNPEHWGVAHIIGVLAWWDEYACEGCYKIFEKLPWSGGDTVEISSKFGNYMSGSGGQKGGLPGPRSVRRDRF